MTNLKHYIRSRLANLAKSVVTGGMAVVGLGGTTATADDDLFELLVFENEYFVHLEIMPLVEQGLDFSIEYKENEIEIEAVSLDGELEQSEDVDVDDDAEGFYSWIELQGTQSADKFRVFSDESDLSYTIEFYLDCEGGDDEVTIDFADDFEVDSGSYTQFYIEGNDGDDTIANHSYNFSFQFGGNGSDVLQGG